jgi:S-DNA-T family DNA segregation ATPase FtsK/SpoIIIE
MAEQKKRGPGRPPGSKNKKTTQQGSRSKSAAPAAETPSRKLFATEPRVRDEIGAIIMIAFGVFLIIALQTDLVGVVGNGISDFLKGAFGFGAFFLPYFLIVYAVLIFAGLVVPFSLRTAIILILLYLTLDLINSGRYAADMKYGILGIKEVYADGVALKNGGVFGMYTGSTIYDLIGIVGLYLLCGVLLLIFVMLLINTPISRFLEHAKERKIVREQERKVAQTEEEIRKSDRERRWAEAALEKSRRLDQNDDFPPFIPDETMPKTPVAPSYQPSYPEETQIRIQDTDLSDGQRKILDMVQDDTLFGKETGAKSMGLQPSMGLGAAAEEKGTGAQGTGLQEKTPDSIPVVYPKTPGRYVLPPLDLLKKVTKNTTLKGLNHGLNERAALLEHTLRSFNVEAKVTNVIEGPSVTRYEIQPAVGVKVSSIVRLADDIALNLRAKSIRLEAPIPGKAAVGIEVENEQREMVSIREIIESKEFQSHKSKLAFAVGKDIGGNAVVADLAKMPHLLIAGATGSGKSVCINTIISSLLCKARPEEVKLVLIDPKMVELGNYNGIPHLLIPVVTDSTKAAAALNWAVAEMTGRYKKFASIGARDIASYNNIMKDSRQKEELLPQIVVIIDELADLMMVASSQVEDAICRLAQLARGAGMHLIVATQRPSVDVITGLIKANIPSRIAFMVSSQIDSRTIIDMPGAEKLVGNGDMLFKPQDLNKPKRIQAPFISDSEVNNIIDHVKSQMEGAVEYSGEVMDHIERGNSYGGADESDDLLPDCIEMVVRAGQASVSMLQRRFRLGYNRAARIMDMMESRGIVGPADGSKPRTILMTEAELDRMKEENGDTL